MKLNKYITVFCMSIFLFSCSSQQEENKNAEREKELAEKEQLLLEKEKELKERESKVAKTLEKEEQVALGAKLLKLWLQESEPYMFNQREGSEDKLVKVDGKTFDMYTMGFSYGNYVVLDALLKNANEDMDDPRLTEIPRLLYDVAGISPYQDDFVYAEHYDGYNPEFVNWVSGLIPEPEHAILGYDAQAFYDRVFKRLIRIYALSYFYLQKEMDIAYEAKKYKEAFTAGNEDFYGPSYLYDNYNELLKLSDVGGPGNLQHPPAFGFWLRRHIDGSIDSCWGLIEKVLNDYDQGWFYKYIGMKTIWEADFDIQEIDEIYTCLWDDAEDAFFEVPEEAKEGRLTIHTYGQFTAGINGVMWYYGLEECIGQIAKEKYPDAFNGVEPFDVEMGTIYDHIGAGNAYDEQDDFKHFNPQFIHWAAKNFVPDPDAKILGQTYQELYSEHFSRFFRQMVEAYQFIKNERRFREECENYVEAMDEADGLDYLYETYRDVLPKYQTGEISDWTPSNAIGFWLRRGIDGSIDAVWEELSKAMNTYDQDWMLDHTP